MSFSKIAAIAALTLGACSTATDDAAPQNPMAVEEAPPPGAGGLRLVVDGVLQPGNTVRFQVTGAQSGQSIYLARGTAEQVGALCPAVLRGLCVDVAGPQLLATLQADGQGRAQLQVTVPQLPEGLIVYFQAATGGATAATSQVVAKWNPKDTGAIMALDLYEIANVAPGSYVGQRNETYYSIINGLDVCDVAADTNGTGIGTLPACTGCVFAFNLTFNNFRDASVSGDCIDLLGFDPTTIAPVQQGWGYDDDYYFTGYGNYPAAMFYSTTSAAWVPASLYVAFSGGTFEWLIPQVNFYWY